MRWREVIYLFVAFVVVFFVNHHASAQIDPKNPAQTCISLDILKEQDKVMGQHQIIRGLNQRQELIIIAADPFTKKWTAWQSVQGVYLCVVAFGTTFTLVEGKP